MTTHVPAPAHLRQLWGEDEGALRDIYVSSTSEADWQRVVEALDRWPHVYTEDGETVPIPKDVGEVFRRRQERATHFRVSLTDRFSVDAYFLDETEIEFTFSPNDVTDDADVYRLFDFIQHLGRVLARPVHMTVESFPGDRPPDDLRYDPAVDRIVTSYYA